MPGLEDTFLGIDIGTGSVKIALLDRRGTILAAEKKEHSILTPQEGWAEVPIEDIWLGVEEKVRELAKNAPELTRRARGIGISTLCPGLTPLDEEGRALANSLIYMDCRSLAEAEALKSRLPEEEYFAITGNVLMPGATSATSILWFRKNRSELEKKTAVYGHLNTFAGKRLTGNFGIDYSNASYTGLFETSGGLVWSDRMLSLAGLGRGKLPPLVPAWEKLGGLANKAFIKAGFATGLPVAMGGGDTACSAFAVGVVEHNQVFESSGTSNVITVCSAKPRFDPRFMNRCHVVPGRWLYHGAMSSTGASVRWLRDEVFRLEGDESFERISALAEAARPDGPCPVFLPYMAGERSPVWDPRARGVFCGLSLHTKREHLVRAVFEACAFGNRQLLDAVEGMTGEKVDAVLSLGGWSAIDAWNRIKADVTGKPVLALDLQEAAVVGAGLLGGMAAGAFGSSSEAAAGVSKTVRKRFDPDPEPRDWYEKRFTVYKELYPRLKDLFRVQG